MEAKKLFMIIFVLICFITLLSCSDRTPFIQPTSILSPVHKTSTLPTEFTTTPKPPPPTIMPTKPPTQNLEKNIFDKLSSGQYILYQGTNGLYGMSPNKHLPVLLSENTDSVAVSSNGKYIVYWLFQRPNDRVLIDVSNQISKTFSVNVECSFMTISPNGELVACGGGEIYILSISSGDTLQLTTWSESKPEDTWEFPVWSPDGNWLAYQNLGDFTPNERDGLYLTSLLCLSKTENCQEVTIGPLLDSRMLMNGPSSVSWSPDSNFLAVPSVDSIRSLNINTKTPSLLTEEYGATSISWSPNGEWIAFTSFSDGNLYLLTPNNDNPIALNIYGEVLGWLTIP